jgi:hypothetical protein
VENLKEAKRAKSIVEEMVEWEILSLEVNEKMIKNGCMEI